MREKQHQYESQCTKSSRFPESAAFIDSYAGITVPSTVIMRSAWMFLTMQKRRAMDRAATTRRPTLETPTS